MGVRKMVEGRSSAATLQYQLDDLVLDLLPRQGGWSDEDYLWLTNHTNRLIEFTDGLVEVLPMPTEEHQLILVHLFRRISPLGISHSSDGLCPARSLHRSRHFPATRRRSACAHWPP